VLASKLVSRRQKLFFCLLVYIIVFTVIASFLFSCEEEFILILDKERYLEKEPVCFLLVNNSNKVLMLPNSAPWKILKNKEVVFSPITPQVLIKLLPGGKKGWCWDMRDNEGKYVPPGEYILLFILPSMKLKKNFFIE
jgi:hypothetical protein